MKGAYLGAVSSDLLKIVGWLPDFLSGSSASDAFREDLFGKTNGGRDCFHEFGLGKRGGPDTSLSACAREVHASRVPKDGIRAVLGVQGIGGGR